jgi:hypothetical protein
MGRLASAGTSCILSPEPDGLSKVPLSLSCPTAAPVGLAVGDHAGTGLEMKPLIASLQRA